MFRAKDKESNPNNKRIGSTFDALVYFVYICPYFTFQMKILLIDNYDSFTYNLFHLIKSASTEDDSIEIILNDKLSVDTTRHFDRIIISPGPGLPSEVPVLKDIVLALDQLTPILGICLGHQAIAESYGASIFNFDKPAHGISSTITIYDHSDLFRNMNAQIPVGRYHSWNVSKQDFPDCLKITASDNDGNIMALTHRQYPVFGVQFHPESFITPDGKTIISNFLNHRQA